MNPEWVMVCIAALGIVSQLFLSARARGRMDERVANLVEEIGRNRTSIGQCQLVENCNRQMAGMDKQIGGGLGAAHKRLDTLESRLTRVERDAIEAIAMVAAVRLERRKE